MSVEFEKIIIKLGDFPVLTENATVYDAISLMNFHKIGAVCITNKNLNLTGIFTDGDLRRIFLKIQKPLSAILIDDITNYMNKKPLIKFKSGKYTHSIYKTSTDFTGINFKELFVADGHHRIEGFAQLDVNKDTKFLSIVFPKSKCLNLPYNRSIKFPDTYKKDSFISDLKTYFHVEELKYHEKIDRFFVIYYQGKYFKIDLKNDFSTNGADCIDFGEFVLKEILNIQDETNDQRVEFVPPTLGTDYLINQVDTGITDLSTLMRPVSMDLVIEYSKNLKFMPPKATWFEPKPLDGLFFYEILE